MAKGNALDRVQLPCGFFHHSPIFVVWKIPHSSLLTASSSPHYSPSLFKITPTYFSLTYSYFFLIPTYFSPLPTSSQITPSNPLKTQNVKKSNLKTSACLFFLLTLHG